ncbi:hypothetical protein EXN66_Car022387 [Channa argus]|uniref:Uncharacterized protein n=1 Tax=Channa argus TaxID=215402 RepID=A0A6G1QVZ1_CHAAH|nr:hypothetical protein EXN66_Car022387 [Channa argus]
MWTKLVGETTYRMVNAQIVLLEKYCSGHTFPTTYQPAENSTATKLTFGSVKDAVGRLS